MRLEVGVGFSKKRVQSREYLFNPRIFGEDVVFLDIRKPLFKIKNFIVADAQHLPFNNCAFDEVYASHLIEHLDNPLPC